MFANIVVNTAVLVMRMKDDAGKVAALFSLSFLGFEHVIANSQPSV